MSSTPTPKSAYEALCAAQSALNEHARRGMDVGRVPHWVATIGVLLRQIETVRPLANNGKHGELHTDSCGCEGHTGPWSIVMWPSEATT
jgi:hypothetical protein